MQCHIKNIFKDVNNNNNNNNIFSITELITEMLQMILLTSLYPFDSYYGLAIL